MQKKLSNTRLLNAKGELVNSGYNTKVVAEYSRKNIKAGALKIKEWDYYLVYNHDYALALTIADNSYMGLVAVSLLDFKNKKQLNRQVLSFFTLGKTKMPSSSKKGDVVVENKEVSIRFINSGKGRSISLAWNNYDKGKDLTAQIKLTQEPIESMIICTPFKESKKMFYYNHKIIGFRASGEARLGEEQIDFKETDSWGILDWGRGVWPYKVMWNWGAATGIVDGKNIGFNIGNGFGDTSKATENMIFYNNWAHKLGEVEFVIPKDKDGRFEFMNEWKIISSDKRLDMTFKPILNRSTKTSVVVLGSKQDQVFGFYSGFVVLDDGKKIEIKDMFGFAEKVVNKW